MVDDELLHRLKNKIYCFNDVEKSLRFILPPDEVDQYILEVKGLVEKYSDNPRISATVKNFCRQLIEF